MIAGSARERAGGAPIGRASPAAARRAGLTNARRAPLTAVPRARLAPLRRALLALAVALLGGACTEAAGPDDGPLLVDAAGPDVQFTAPSAAPPDPLRVVVRRLSDLAPVENVDVTWEVAEGQGAALSIRVARTDSAGIASTTATAGREKGRYVIRARAGDAAALFELWAVDAPALDSVPASARVGDTIPVVGRGFSTVPAHDVIQLGGVRAKVVRATATELAVEVPPCLPPGPAALRVALGSQQSATRTVQIAAAPTPEPFPVGGAITLDGGATGAAACRRLPAGSYLMVLAAVGEVAGARHPAALAAFGGGTSQQLPRTAPSAGARPPAEASTAQARWDALLRQREREMLAGQRPAPAPTPPRAAAPQPGDRRDFEVVQPGSGFRRVSAVARWVGPTLALYEDVETPAGQIAAADYAAFGAAFEDPIGPTVTGIFGRPTDLDGNQRVVVLFTPAVNRLTERESRDGFIGGFFYGLDLLPERAHSNRGEVLYALVPDPEGRFGDARPRSLVLESVPVILAHELVHMVSFGERVVGRGAPGSETTWLAEGMAEMAEDRVAEAYAARGDGQSAAAFRSGNLKRARLFLQSGPATSLLTAAGGATLAERGASWLFLRYLTEQYGGDELLRSITRTTRTGTANAAAAAGRPWPTLVLDWAVGVYDGDEPGLVDPLAADPRYRYRELRPRESLGVAGQPYPLVPVELDARATVATELLAGAVAHYRVAAVAPITVAVASGGAASPPTPGVALRVVRLR